MFGFARLPIIAVLSLLLLVAASFLPEGPARAQEEMPAAPVEAGQVANIDTTGATSCIKCHDEPPATLILHTVHAQMADPSTPFADKQCQSCHGTSQAHLVKPAEGQKRAAPDVVFGPTSPTPAEAQNEVCLGCHEGGIRMNWATSDHSSADVACATCHDMHAIRDPVLVRASQPEVCFACHFEQRAQSLKRSRHPIKEGLVVCADCHNPHGSFGRSLLKEATVNETCYQCHAEKRGPFLWEHAPVADECTNCHTPHGSSQPRLLVVRAPFLCQQCHAETQHPSTLYSGEFLPPSSATGAARLLAKACLDCHPMIHGTNHPAGVRLTR